MLETMNRPEKSKSGNFGHRPPAVGIAKVGAITFNPATYEMMGKPTHVRLLFPEDDNTVLVMEPTDSPGPDTFEVKTNREGVQYRLNSRKFVKNNDIEPSYWSPYPVRRDGDLFVVEKDSGLSFNKNTGRLEPLSWGTRGSN